jgi:hypothetical protein
MGKTLKIQGDRLKRHHSSLCRLRLYQVVQNCRARGRDCHVHIDQHGMKPPATLAWTCLQPSARNPAPRRFVSSRRRWRSPRTDHKARASLVTRVFLVGRSERIALVRTYPRGQEQGLVSYLKWIEALTAVRAHLSRFGLEIWYLPLSFPEPSGSGTESYFPPASITHFSPILPPKSLAGDGRRRCHQPQAIGLIPHQC